MVKAPPPPLPLLSPLLLLFLFFFSYIMKNTTLAHGDASSSIKNFLLACLAFVTGGRIQTLPSGQVRIIFKWQYFIISLVAACIATTIIIQTTTMAWNKVDPNDDESIFLPFTSKKVPAKWRGYITNQPLSHPTHHPKRK